MREKIRIALAQVASKRENKEENIKKIEKIVAKAVMKKAELIIFPELFLTGYVLRDQIYELAETIPGCSTRRIEQIVRKAGVYLVFGMPELSEKTRATIFNSAVFIGPEGLIGKYRKRYLPNHSVFEEKRQFRAGYQAAAFDTPIGKIGFCICYDVFFPELIRLTRLLGSQLIICISASPAIRKNYFEILTAARALENTAFIAYVNLVGMEDGMQFWGGSRVINPTGDIIAKAKYDEEDLVICDIDYGEMRAAEVFVPTLKDLRPEIFDELKKKAEAI